MVHLERETLKEWALEKKKSKNVNSGNGIQKSNGKRINEESLIR